MPDKVTWSEEAQYTKMCEIETRLIVIEKKLAALLAILLKDKEKENQRTCKGFGNTN